MIRDDIHDALNRGDKDHASELLMVLRHFLETHPEAQLKRAEVVERLPHASQNSSTKTILGGGYQPRPDCSSGHTASSYNCSGWDGADRRSSSGPPSPLRSPAACLCALHGKRAS